jgi:histidinol-phosphate aminotransferase
MASKLKVQAGLARLPGYAHSKSIEEVKRQFNLDRVIKLASNENTFGTAPLTLEAMQALVALNYYPDPRSTKPAAAIAARLRVPADWVTVGNGADALIHTLTRAFLEDGDEVIIGEVTFPSYA